MSTYIPTFGPAILGIFALIPQSTIGKFYIWNMFTAGYIEVFIPNLLLTISMFLLIGRRVEPIWGSKELALFVLLINSAAGITTFCFLLVSYFVTRSQNLIFAPVGGFSAVISGLLVALKQLFPSHTFGYAMISIPGNYLPFLAIVVAVVAWALGQSSAGNVVFVLTGVQIGWTYLRFYQRREFGRGEPSDAFAFRTLFPNPLAPIAGILGAIAFTLLKPLLTLSQAQDEPASNKTLLPTTSVDPIDAERRRQRAILALDARLGSASSVSESNA